MKRRSVILIGILAILSLQMECNHDCIGLVTDLQSHEFTLSKDVEAGTFVADISVNTQECVFSYSILSGSFAEAFDLDSLTGFLSVSESGSQVFGTAMSGTLTILVMSGSSEQGEMSVTITLEGSNCIIPDLPDHEFTLSEDVEAGTVVSDISVDTLDCVFSYSILSGTFADAFEIDASTGVLSVSESGSLDYETAESGSLIIQVSNEDSEQDEMSVTINLEDVDDTRYLHPVFDNFTLEEKVVYGNNASVHWMNVYEPTGDTEENRSVVLLVPGGAFDPSLIGNTQVLYKPLAEKLARAGYVAVIINYATLLDGDNTIEEQYEAFIYAYYDLKAALRYFYKDADTENVYRIDTNNIFLNGYSAGAEIGLFQTFANTEDELSELEKQLADAYEGFEGNSGNPGYSSQVRGLIFNAGYLLDLAKIKAGDPAIMSICGVNDRFIEQYTNDNGGIVYGARDIIAKAKEVGIYTRSIEVQNHGHNFVTESTYPGIFDEVIDFIFYTRNPLP